MKVFRYDEVPVVETTSGKLKGYFYDGEYIFKGVPYAYAERFQRRALPIGKGCGRQRPMGLYVR